MCPEHVKNTHRQYRKNMQNQAGKDNGKKTLHFVGNAPPP